MSEFGAVLVEHSADGTTVSGTERGDREAIEALKACGFRWSRNLGAWFLPRTWGESTRLGRVRRLQAQLGDRVEVEASEAPRRSAAEREAEKRERAAARAERLEARAAKAAEAAEEEAARSRAIADHIPLGQPVLVGHHSQRRHERDLERIDRHMSRSVAEHERAEEVAAAAERARRTAAGAESVVRIGNRIEKLEAELRLIERRLHGTGKAIHGDDKPATGSYAERLERRRVELVGELEHNRAKLAEAGGVAYSRETVKAGDLVRVRGIWYPVLRANVKSVSVPSAMAAAESSWSDTAPWREVQAHLSRAEATPEKVRRLASRTSRAFEGLRAKLEALAAELEAEQLQGGER